MKANGQDAADGKFTVTRITDVAVKFALAEAIDGVSTTLATAEGGYRAISITTQGATEVTIASLSGKTSYSSTVSSDTTIGLPAGVYVVTLSQNGHTATQKLLVK